MVAIDDCFTVQLRRRLKTTCMGLGLVRLLQDAGRPDEARAALCLLESALHEGAGTPNQPRRKPVAASPMKGVSSKFLRQPRRARHETKAG